jgi:DNA replication and repair protein RecN
MLKQLYVKNFTLIDELNIGFKPGFSVITGETGAGKSIILGAIHLLLGQRADIKQIKSGCSKCIVEAHFTLASYGMEAFFNENNIDYDPDDCIIRREVNANGKSRAFVNDTPVSLGVMRDLGEQLVDIHSQHQNLLLQKEDFQLSVVDIIAGDEKEREAYRKAYTALRQAERDYEAFEAQCQRSRENEEFLRFQFAELDKASLVEGEQAELEQQFQMLSHAEDIKGSLYDASSSLSAEETGAVQLIRHAAERIQDITDVYPEVKALAKRLDSSYIELKDIAQEIDNRLEQVEFDPRQLQVLNDRLDLIYALEHKFHAASVEELIAERERIKSELQNIDGGDEQLALLKQAVDQALADCKAQAARLSAARKKAAVKVESEMKTRLAPLGIPNVRFSIELTQKDFSSSGCDKVSFLFSANSSTPLQPVSQVASGGEVARVMLSLKAMISGAVKLPTIIFDEIDTGVSGRVAEKMAQIMREMGDNNRQVISITHLPQIAAMGLTHYKVSKEETPQGTISNMLMLSDEQRVTEIAQMLSGSSVTEAAIENARSLLANQQ